MKLTIYLILFVFLLPIKHLKGQQASIVDSLINITKSDIEDSSRVLIYEQLAFQLMNNKPQKALEYAQKGLDLANNIDFEKGKARNLNRMGSIFRITTNYAKSLEMHFKAIEVAEKINDQEGLARTYNNLANLYQAQKDYRKALEYCFKANKIAQIINNEPISESIYNNIGGNYARLNILDSAKLYAETVYRKNSTKKNPSFTNLMLLANVYAKLGDSQKALKLYNLSLPILQKNTDLRNISLGYFEMALVYKKIGKLDSCKYFAEKALELSKEVKHFDIINQSSLLLSELYEGQNPKIALEYFKTAIVAKDSVFNIEKYNQVENIVLNENLRLQELEKAKSEFDTQKKYGLLLAILTGLLIITFIQFKNNKQKQKANQLLHSQKLAIETQKTELNNSLETLKSTQMQLIQQEKLASLGELTAGIAHEIQNPLNFVNNFSELSGELANEIKIEIEKAKIPDKDKLYLYDMLGDLEQNQQKIHQHGVRASNIVKGMLDHSRSSKSEKSNIDLNLLADEYLRLSFLGTRSKINDFNADYQLVANENIPSIVANSQDISRVILNLINNAFYAVWERTKAEVKSGNQNYSPKVKVFTDVLTENETQFVLLKVEDNGMGIKEEIKNKIFQPFFTTKPTGHGTGLGLSLSYDIIVKGHNGSLTVDSEMGIGTVFNIKIPV